MVMVNGAEAVFEAESVTSMVTGNATTRVVGTPEISPLEDSPRPLGNPPAMMLQVYGSTPPVADMVNAYGTPTTPLGNEVVVIVSVPPPAEVVKLNGVGYVGLYCDCARFAAESGPPTL